MKLLHLNLYFKLPDDFDGNVNDALREMIKYRESQGLTSLECDKEPPLTPQELNANPQALWETFLDAVKDGKRISGVGTIGKVNWP